MKGRDKEKMQDAKAKEMDNMTPEKEKSQHKMLYRHDMLRQVLIQSLIGFVKQNEDKIKSRQNCSTHFQIFIYCLRPAAQQDFQQCDQQYNVSSLDILVVHT
jgi:hypothetical protein